MPRAGSSSQTACPYARQLGATHLVDFATLTGAMERALGDFYAGVVRERLRVENARDRIRRGERRPRLALASPFPLPALHRLGLRDLKNSNIRSQGVPVFAAEFLREFAGEGPWAHIDMAGTGFFTWPRHDYLWQRGGTGYGVRLICELADRLAATA
jgi:leucyl aminopeptidase